MSNTPGPWKVQPVFLTVYTHSQGETGLTIALANVLDGQLIADQHDVPGKEAARAEAVANAYLIAAAPQLRAALEDIAHDAAEFEHGDTVAENIVRGFARKARAALALANEPSPHEE